MRANALQIYLAKPMSRFEYIAGKFAVLAFFLLLVTWLPATMLLVVQVVFAGNLQFLLGQPLPDPGDPGRDRSSRPSSSAW